MVNGPFRSSTGQLCVAQPEQYPSYGHRYDRPPGRAVTCSHHSARRAAAGVARATQVAGRKAPASAMAMPAMDTRASR